MTRVTGLYHYPIKGLSAQPLGSVAFEPDKPVPMDRVFALARPGGAVDPFAPAWAKKSQFVMLMLDEALGRIETYLDPETLTVRVHEQGVLRLEGPVTDTAVRVDLENLVFGLVPGLARAPRLVHLPGGHFMDKPGPVISLINLATVRALEALWGETIDPLRFRANIYIDGLEPWAEFDLAGQEITIGASRFSVYGRNGRCAATNVDPKTGARNRDIPGKLRAHFGHKDLGLYLVSKTSGRMAVGDQLLCAGTARAPQTAGATPRKDGARFICKGCYYVYVEDAGTPGGHAAPGLPFAALPPEWRCPDCGCDATAFSPQKTCMGDRALADGTVPPYQDRRDVMPRTGWDILQSWLRFLTRGRVSIQRGLAVAVVCAAAASAVRFGLEPLVGTSVPFITFFPALLACSLAAGAWPAFLVLVVGSALAGFYWMPPAWAQAARLGPAYAILAFWIIGAFLILMGTVLRTLVRELADARDHADLMAHEMKHRAGNLLGVIQAIARQTARSAVDLDDYQERFEARLLALSRAQDFAGGLPGDAPNLETFLAAALEPFGRDRFALAGPPAALPPGLASAFALLLHELGTNAMKYGALSVSEGRCAIAWIVANGRVQLEWRESGGPPVAPPGRSGFGSKLLKLAFPPETGHAAITYDPAGVRCEISFPAAR